MKTAVTRQMYPDSDQMFIERLPPEIWHRVFRLVHKEDLLNICLVNRKFLAVASLPFFWREITLSRKKMVEKNAWQEFLKLGRFKYSYSIKLAADQTNQYMFDNKRWKEKRSKETKESMINLMEIYKTHKSIKSLKMNFMELSQVEISDINQIVNRLESVDLTSFDLPESQVTPVIESIVSSGRLKSLILSGITMTGVNPLHFHHIGESLEEINLNYTLLTKDQLTSLLQGISKAKRVKSLSLADIKEPLYHHESSLLADCISSHIEYLDLSSSLISSESKLAMLAKLKLGFHKIKTLCLNNVNLCFPNYQIKLLAESLSSVPELELSGCFLDDHNIVEALLLEIIVQRKVKKLDISRNIIRNIDQSILIDAFSPMTAVNLSQTKFNQICPTQTKALLTSFAHSAHLEDLKLNGYRYNLCHIELSVLGSLVANIRYLYLNNTELESGQIVQLLTECK